MEEVLQPWGQERVNGMDQLIAAFPCYGVNVV